MYWIDEIKVWLNYHYNAPIHVSLFISLIIYLIATDKPAIDGIAAIPNGKTLYILTEYKMNYLYKYSDFPQS